MKNDDELFARIAELERNVLLDQMIKIKTDMKESQERVLSHTITSRFIEKEGSLKGTITVNTLTRPAYKHIGLIK